MKAMILAAGRGGRMGALTDAMPKPLLPAGGQALIEYHLAALAKAGITEVVINICFQAEKIKATLGDGSRYGVQIVYSSEEDVGRLETGGGIYHALPLLGEQPFVVVNGDIWTDYSFEQLPTQMEVLAHLVLFDNPSFHHMGDFSLHGSRVGLDGEEKYTYMGLCVLHPQLFADCSAGKYSIVPLIRQAVVAGKVTGEHYTGKWFDVGRPDRYYHLQSVLEQ